MNETPGDNTWKLMDWGKKSYFYPWKNGAFILFTQQEAIYAMNILSVI